MPGIRNFEKPKPEFVGSSLSAKDPESIQKMFSRISSRYDLINSILSFGIHTYWKKQLVKQSELSNDSLILDCASGTGDIAFLFERQLKDSCCNGRIIGTDFCEPMLKLAQKRAKELHSDVQFRHADLTQLPFDDHSFDLASISFGIRNVYDPKIGLTEMTRVLRPGGQLLILEFGQSQVPVFREIYQWYSTVLLPRIGGLLSGERKAYQYLQSSSSHFPSGKTFIDQFIDQSRFREIQIQAFQFGIVYLYKLIKKN